MCNKSWVCLKSFNIQLNTDSINSTKARSQEAVQFYNRSNITKKCKKQLMMKRCDLKRTSAFPPFYASNIFLINWRLFWRKCFNFPLCQRISSINCVWHLIEIVLKENVAFSCLPFCYISFGISTTCNTNTYVGLSLKHSLVVTHVRVIFFFFAHLSTSTKDLYIFLWKVTET